MTSGVVYLVGAGPGHPDYLTLRAAALIGRADIVVFDRLVHPDVVALAPAGAERMSVGKPVGRHESMQDEINELLVAKAREHKVVVRLKGGDPFVFGRGAEEALYLARHGVRFEVVPGVSSALSAPLLAGIPVTHRGVAGSVAIATGHGARDVDRQDWEAIARMDTVVVLMCMASLDAVITKLIEHGRGAETPAAIVQAASWPEEQAVTARLGTVAQVARRAGIHAPATLIVGETVALGEKLARVALETSATRLTPCRETR